MSVEDWSPSVSTGNTPTARQLKLLQELLVELQDCRAFEASELERKLGRLKTRGEASELINKTIRTLREYNRGR